MENAEGIKMFQMGCSYSTLNPFCSQKSVGHVAEQVY